MKILIITEGFQNTGYGHITRCLSLYQAFKEINITPRMIVNGDKTARQFLGDSHYTILNWLEDPAPLYEMADNSDIVIVDSYKAEASLYEEIYKRTKLLAVLDDYMRLNYKAHVVINGTIGSENFDYRKEGDIKYLLGAEYIPLRKEFWNVEEKEITGKIQNVMITLGGQDIRKLTQPILGYLIEHAPYLNYFVVARENFEIDFKKYTSIGNVDFVFDADAAKMKELMLKSDIAVSAAGQSIYELARVGVPALAICVADNQVKNLQGWVKNGFISEGLYYDDKDLISKIGMGISRFNDMQIRKEICAKGRAAINGQGAKILAEFLTAFKVN